jgi:hypothetical protein
MFRSTSRHTRLWSIVLALTPSLFPVAYNEKSFNLNAKEDDRSALEEEHDPAHWGNLEMRFVFDGVPPQPLAMDESLLVNPKDRGIANVAVWLRRDALTGVLPVHPSYRKLAAKDIAVGIVADALVPRVTMVQTTQKVMFTNADPHGHNIRAHVFNNTPFNHLLLAGESIERQFPKSESPPMRLDDAIKPGLSGYIHVYEHPYQGVSTANGKLRISNVPIGKWTFVVWHERAGYVKETEVGGKPVKWERGCVQLNIQLGENDLGEVKLSPKILNK